MKKFLLLLAVSLFILPATAQRKINAHWCALGTSITWYNENVEASLGGFTRGYQSRVMDKISFSRYSNQAVNGGAVKTALNKVIKADYYTIEHGINDWGNSVPVGTLEDYINGTDNGTFASAMRKIVNYIFRLNPKAKVVLCTPRKGFGFGGYLPDHWYDAKKGIYLKEYADMARRIAEFESIPVADFYEECGGDRTLIKESLDGARASQGITNDAVHPNDLGYQRMANVLIDALERVLVD